MTEIGAIRVRLRRFLDHVNRTGQKLNFGLVLFRFFPFSDFPLIFLIFSYLFLPKMLLIIIPLQYPFWGRNIRRRPSSHAAALSRCFAALHLAWAGARHGSSPEHPWSGNTNVNNVVS